jgi:hypothetical protein
MRIAELLEEPIDWRYKTRPATREPLTLSGLAERRWNLLGGDLLLPAMILKQSALEHNIARVAEYCREHGVSLAPHGKTTMAPQLFARQLDAGAWGMTAATVAHVGIYRHFGVPRILLMNELVEPAALAWIADELASDPDFDSRASKGSRGSSPSATPRRRSPPSTPSSRASGSSRSSSPAQERSPGATRSS